MHNCCFAAKWDTSILAVLHALLLRCLQLGWLVTGSALWLLLQLLTYLYYLCLDLLQEAWTSLHISCKESTHCYLLLLCQATDSG